MDTTVIIPCWIIDEELLEITEECLESFSGVELILIDNGSKVGSDYLMEKADVYVRNKENLGYVKAMNQGLKLASHEYIVCGNNDYIMSEGWNEAMKKTLDIKDCGIARVNTKGDTPPEKPTIYYGTPGGWFMLERSTIDDVGLFDERFFNTFGDTDFLWRFWQRGWEVYVTGEVTVEHKNEQSLKRFPQRSKESNKAYELVMEKWEGSSFLREIHRRAKLREQG